MKIRFVLSQLGKALGRIVQINDLVIGQYTQEIDSCVLEAHQLSVFLKDLNTNDQVSLWIYQINYRIICAVAYNHIGLITPHSTQEQTFIKNLFTQIEPDAMAQDSIRVKTRIIFGLQKQEDQYSLVCNTDNFSQLTSTTQELINYVIGELRQLTYELQLRIQILVADTPHA